MSTGICDMDPFPPPSQTGESRMMPSPPMLPICNRLQGPCSWHQRDQSTQEIAEVVGDDPEKQPHDPRSAVPRWL